MELLEFVQQVDPGLAFVLQLFPSSNDLANSMVKLLMSGSLGVLLEDVTDANLGLIQKGLVFIQLIQDSLDLFQSLVGLFAI